MATSGSPTSEAGALPRFATKTVTFDGGAGTGAVGNVPLFTVTGQVLIRRITGTVTVNLAGASATLSLGVAGSVALFIAATVATTMLTTARYWVSATPTALGIAVPALCSNILIDANVVGTVAIAGVSSGALRIDVEYSPVSPGATLA